MKKNNKSKNSNKMINSWLESFKTPLFTFFVIAIPCLLIWIFFSNDFPFASAYHIEYSWWIKLLIGIAFIVFSFLITLLCVYLKILKWSIFIFSLPITICFITIFVTDQLEPWIRSLIIIPFFLLIIPISILVKKIEIKQMIKNKKQNSNEDNIIGYKQK